MPRHARLDDDKIDPLRRRAAPQGAGCREVELGRVDLDGHHAVLQLDQPCLGARERQHVGDAARVVRRDHALRKPIRLLDAKAERPVRERQIVEKIHDGSNGAANVGLDVGQELVAEQHGFECFMRACAVSSSLALGRLGPARGEANGARAAQDTVRVGRAILRVRARTVS